MTITTQEPRVRLVVDGCPISFLLDTGATFLVLREFWGPTTPSTSPIVGVGDYPESFPSSLFPVALTLSLSSPGFRKGCSEAVSITLSNSKLVKQANRPYLCFLFDQTRDYCHWWPDTYGGCPYWSCQAVPAGSHVRLNLQTGAREAKLQYKDKFQNNLKGLKKGRRLDINTNTYTSQDLKSALAKLKEGAEMESSKEDKARQAEVKRLFRPIEELKKDFDELNVVIETDMQIMVRLITKFNSSSSSLEEKIAALFDLEYYVHQMDNAQDLLSFGGLQVVINGLNSTEPLVKEYAAFVLGAAFSSCLGAAAAVLDQ
ncbi:PREDICTED: nucleotide exchange factor SIL1-like [Galeopterus variegatus]|uniref:Nucleotide exchange factor SIL1 n=1 Tax=Galeopterus variegatus TaxID=482537 RepID=A0ABM0SE07_GALVR|nr:PREDICTED: nucleotide exchange factor SIL1-like [Galeopterus variegatus]